jgi:hypothetical protein
MDRTAASLRVALPERTVGRGTKKGKRSSEQALVKKGKLWLRKAINVIVTVGEDPEEPQPNLMTESEALRRPFGTDAQEVGRRIAAVLALYGSDRWKELLAAELPRRSDLVARGEALAAGLPSAKTEKKTAQGDAVVETADLDALDGQLWTYFKAAIRSGRSYWLEQGDRSRAAEYNLDLLHGVRGAPVRAPSLPPATPPAAPAPPATTPGTPVGG